MTAATVAAPANSIYFGNKLSNVGLTCLTMSHLWLTAETDEANDAVEFGYIPAGVVVVAVIHVSPDLDTGSALRQKITIGSTDIKTGSTIGSAGGNEFIGIAPMVISTPTKLIVTTTTGATTHANGTQYVHVLYYSGA